MDSVNKSDADVWKKLIFFLQSICGERFIVNSFMDK